MKKTKTYADYLKEAGEKLSDYGIVKGTRDYVMQGRTRNHKRGVCMNKHN